METIYSNDKIELTFDDYEREITMSVYDNHGHYLDDVKFSMREFQELTEVLSKFDR